MRKLNRARIKPAIAKIVIDEACPHLSSRGLPEAAQSWRDGSRNLRRVQADYADGWRVIVRISKPDANGQQYVTSSSASLKLTIAGTTE